MKFSAVLRNKDAPSIPLQPEKKPEQDKRDVMLMTPKGDVVNLSLSKEPELMLFDEEHKKVLKQEVQAVINTYSDDQGFVCARDEEQYTVLLEVIKRQFKEVKSVSWLEWVLNERMVAEMREAHDRIAHMCQVTLEKHQERQKAGRNQ